MSVPLLVLSKLFLNFEIVLLVIVQLLYDVVNQVDCKIGQNRQIQANYGRKGQ